MKILTKAFSLASACIFAFFSIPAQATHSQKHSIQSELKLEGIPLSCRSRLAESSPNGYLKVFELFRISEKYAESKLRSESFKWLSQAFQIAKEVIAQEESYTVSQTGESTSITEGFLPVIANQYAQIGYFDEALEVANTIQLDLYKADALAHIAAAYVKAEKPSKVAEILLQALKFAKKSSRDSILARLAGAYAEVQQFEQAAKLTKEIESGYFKVESLSKIATGYARVGSKDQALVTLFQALQATNTIEDDSTKSSALATIAVNYADLEEFNQAIQIANSKKASAYRDYALTEITRAYAKAGQYQEAFNVANYLINPFPKTRALMAIADTSFNRKQPQEAVEVLLKALLIARTIKDEIPRTIAYSEITGKLAEAEQYEQAVQLAKTIEDKPERERWLRLLTCTNQQN